MPSTDIVLRLADDPSVPQLFKFKRGSYGEKNNINFFIQNSDGSDYDITSLTLKMVLFEIYRKIPIFEKTLDIVDSVKGTAKYEPKIGELDLIREYYLRVSLEDSTNKEWTELASLQVR